MLTARNIVLALDGHLILDDVSLQTQPGELIGIIGPNGAGKSSLLRVMAGLQKFVRGEVCWGEEQLASQPPRELARQLAYLPQQELPAWPLQVEHLVGLGRAPWRRPWGRHRAQDIAAIETALAMTELTGFRHRSVRELSGGELRRVLLARVFAGQPRCILADEPVAALDPYHQLHVMELLQQHAAGGGTVVVALHELSLAARFCDRVVLLHQGAIAATGSAAEVLRPEYLETVYRVKTKVLRDQETVIVSPYRRLC